jgi:hypothetical protein
MARIVSPGNSFVGLPQGRNLMSGTTAWTCLTTSIFVLALSTPVGCGVSKRGLTPPTCSGDCSCTEDTCVCEAGGTCSFGMAPSAPGDGTTATGGSTSTAPPDDVSYHCDSNNQCDLVCGTGCTNTCDGRSTCTGSCSSNCTSSCAGTSQCTIETGVNSQVTCAGGSNCAVTLDTGSTITCQGESTCTVQCPIGGCRAECAGASSCTVVCGGTSDCTIECSGMMAETCPAGSTCSSTCARVPPRVGDAGPPADAGRLPR